MKDTASSTTSPDVQASCPQPTPSLCPRFDMAAESYSPSGSLEEEIEQLDEEYTKIESLVLETIKKLKVPHTTMLQWVQVLPLALKAQFSEILRMQAKELSSASNVDELFMILSPYWNSLHPTLLEHLVKKLADDNLNTRMKHYTERLQNFRLRTTLGNFIDKWIHGIPPGFNEYVLKLGEGWRDKTMEDLNQFMIGLSRQQCFERHIAYLNKVTAGCLAVVIAFPQCCFPLRPDDELKHYLQENMVLHILTESKCVLNLQGNEGSHDVSESSDKESTNVPSEKGKYCSLAKGVHGQSPWAQTGGWADIQTINDTVYS